MPLWETLIDDENGEHTIAPWLGGRFLRFGTRVWRVFGELPLEHGWYCFKVDSRRRATVSGATSGRIDLLDLVHGYLVGDRIVPDRASAIDSDPTKIARQTERVHLIEEGLDLFVSITAGRPYPDGPLVFITQEMPRGAEAEALSALLDGKTSLDGVKGVSPGLDAAFRMEVWRRAQVEKRRIELEALRAEAEAKRIREERRAELLQSIGDATIRREIAKIDFGEGARRALAVGGAAFLDHRRVREGEFAVRFRLDGRRFECVVDNEFRVIDAGLCLRDHHGVAGDTWLSLEAVPAVYREAIETDRLVIYRHAR